MSLPSDTLSLFRANQFLNWPDSSSNPQSTALEASTLTDISLMQYLYKTLVMFLNIYYINNWKNHGRNAIIHYTYVYCTQRITVRVLLRKMEVGGDRESIVIGYTSTYIISAFHNWVWFPTMTRCTWYNIVWYILS